MPHARTAGGAILRIREESRADSITHGWIYDFLLLELLTETGWVSLHEHLLQQTQGFAEGGHFRSQILGFPDLNDKTVSVKIALNSEQIHTLVEELKCYAQHLTQGIHCGNMSDFQGTANNHSRQEKLPEIKRH
ncbi:MAG: hypothetical protein HY986_13450 [Candidatus Melainabacteria bacterium]|nr:hypothetical protein [Candidatus Melainabacteria bacterium]